MADIVGDNSSETLPGTNAPDTIQGLGGTDVITGLNGVDRSTERMTRSVEAQACHSARSLEFEGFTSNIASQ